MGSLWILCQLKILITGGQHIDLHTGSSSHKISKYEALPENQRTKVKEILHIMDKFCVGDAAYHALTVLEHDLPRSYMIKQCRNDINGLFVIRRTPGELIGAQMSFKDELQRKIKGYQFMFR